MRNLRRVFFSLVLSAATVFSTTARGSIAKDLPTLGLMADAYVANPTFVRGGKVSVYTDVQSNAGYGGSGVLISSNWVLTAGHMITYADELGRTIEQIRFKMGSNTLNPVKVVAADFWTVFPGYDGPIVAGQGVDLALIHLTETVCDLPPIVMYSGTQSDLTGWICWATGTGSRGIAGQGLIAGDYLERAGQNIIGDCALPLWADSDYLVCRFSEPSDSSAQPLEWHASPGNSGGGWWVYGNGQWQLVGIISAVTTDSYYNFGNKTVAYPVGTQLDWIYSVIGVTPPLSVRKVDPATIKVTWPAWATSFVLQTSTNLDGTNWTTVATPPTADGTNQFVLAAPSAPAQFWRLARQPSAPARATAPRPPAPVGLYDDLIGQEP